MPAQEWTNQEINKIKTALRRRGDKSLAQVSRELESDLGRPYSGVYAKVREVLNETEPAEVQTENVPEPQEPEQGRSFLTFIQEKIAYHESEAARYSKLLNEYQEETGSH